MLNVHIELLPFKTVVPFAACPKCFDTNIWLTPENLVRQCPMIPGGHRAPNSAAQMVKRAARRLNELELWVNQSCFDLARILTHYSTGKPCSRQSLFEHFFDGNHTESYKLRKFHSWIEELRTVWLLPVGSRKDEPSGYWIISDLEDCKNWLRHANAAPIKQLSTNWKVAKNNFPKLAGQKEFEFMNYLESVE